MTPKEDMATHISHIEPNKLVDIEQSDSTEEMPSVRPSVRRPLPTPSGRPSSVVGPSVCWSARRLVRPPPPAPAHPLTRPFVRSSVCPSVRSCVMSVYPIASRRPSVRLSLNRPDIGRVGRRLKTEIYQSCCSRVFSMSAVIIHTANPDHDH